MKAFVSLAPAMMVAALAAPMGAQSPVVPVVTSAPFVMPSDIALQALFSGDVRLSVTTDGARVVKVEVLAGVSLLADATVASVRQWQFAPHAPTNFTTTFRYRYKSAKRCPESDIETEVSGRLPVEVTLTVARFPVSIHGEPRCGTSNDGKVISLANLAGTLTCECRGQAPVADALIIVWQPGAPFSNTVRLRSDERGRFAAPSIPRGHYYVDIHKPGFRFRRLLVNLTDGAGADGLQVPFRPEPHPDPIPPLVMPRALPTYPDAARAKGIEGDVRLVRDASGLFTVLSGAPELASSAQAHARRLSFEGPSPPVEISYRYRLLDGDCGPDQNSSIGMRLPSTIVVTAKKPIACLAGARGRR